MNRRDSVSAGPTGRAFVKCNGTGNWATTPLSEGQATIMSLVAQSTGQYILYSNGTQLLSTTTTSDLTSLAPNVVGGYTNTLSVGNNGPDGASTFNGDIGDVAFYKVALTDAERQQLETSIAGRFGITPPTYAITASAGAGGTISPSGAKTVAYGGSQKYRITSNTDYAYFHEAGRDQ